LVVLISAIIATVELVGSPFSHQTLDTSNLITDAVTRGPFRITVSEKGELDSLKSATITSSVEGTTTIISIVKEGTQVKAGQLVCELDSSTLVDKQKEQQIKLTQGIADLEKAKKNVEIQKEQNASDLAAAELLKTLADLDLEKFKLGLRSQQQNEKDGELQLAEEDLIRARDTYDFSKRIAKKGYKTQQELEANRVAVKKAEINKSKAETALMVLTTYEFKRTLAELEEKTKEADREIKRVMLQGEASLDQFNAELKARELAKDVEQEKADKLAEQIKACKLYAPQDGEVVYPSQRSRRNDSQAIEEGATVRQMQEILKLPDLTQMKVDAKIHESRIGLVRVGMPVIVRVDAAGDQLYFGKVDFISSVPLSPDYRSPDLRQYSAIVHINSSSGDISLLKPGLTANIEIIAEHRENVLQAPVQSVVTLGKVRFVYVVNGESVERRDVSIGQASAKSIEIITGVHEGEQVVMNPRTAFAEEIADLAATISAESPEEKIEALPDDAKGADPATRGENAPRQQAEGGDAPNGEERGKHRGPRDENGKRGEGRRGDGQRGEGGSEGKRGNRDPAAMLQRLDKNSDGKLSKDELSERMQPIFDTLDVNKDGFADRDEMAKLRELMPRRGNGDQPGGGPRQ
jgi:HlyD family secretion protein